MRNKLSRRGLLRAAGIAAAFKARTGRAEVAGSSERQLLIRQPPSPRPPVHVFPDARAGAAFNIRMKAATAQAVQVPLPQSSNADETALPRWIASYTKG